MSQNIETLVAENAKTWSDELRVARSMPRDEAATAKLKDDPDKLARLANLAEIKPEQLADVAVRGTNVSFQVSDADGVLSAGFFPLARLNEDADENADAGGVRTPRKPDDSSIGHGTAPVPSVATTGDQSDDGDDDPPDVGAMSGESVANLLKDTPEGVDVNEVLAAEWARPDGPRTAVQRAAKKLGLLDEDGKPKTAETAPPA
jgi:hypothetical protein